MKRLGIFLLPPGCDASPFKGYPQNFIRLWYPFVHQWVKRGTVRVKHLSCPRTQHNGSNPGCLIQSRVHYQRGHCTSTLILIWLDSTSWLNVGYIGEELKGCYKGGHCKDVHPAKLVGFHEKENCNGKWSIFPCRKRNL